MRSRLSYVLLAAALLLLNTVAGWGSNTRVTGTVEDPSSTPIPGASVTLLSVDGVLQTDALKDGSFIFENISPGAYDLEVAVPGFFRKKLSVNLQGDATPAPLVIHLEICMSTAEKTCGADFPITYGPLGPMNSRLTGVVRDFEGLTPIPNADVSIQRLGDAQSGLRRRSDRTGRFTFENVPAGIYDLKIAKRGYQSVEVKKLIKPRGHDVFIDTGLLQQGIVIISQ
jgi:hypothetical protein